MPAKLPPKHLAENDTLKEIDGNMVKGEEHPGKEPDGVEEPPYTPTFDPTRSPLRQNPVIPEDRATPTVVRKPSKWRLPPRPLQPPPKPRTKRSSTVSTPNTSPLNLSVPSRPQTATQSPQTSRISPFPSPLLSGATRKTSHENFRPQRSPNTDQWSSWNRSFTQDEARGSMTSSGIDTESSKSTKHSSVFTKMSSISDAELDFDDIDDFLDLYTKRDDAPDPMETEMMNSPNDEEESQRSKRISEAIKDSMGSVLSPPIPGVPEQPSSAAIMSGDVFRDMFPGPPPLQQQTSTHDQYGFRKYSRDITVEQYDAWYNDYTEIRSRRTTRWISFLESQGLSTKNPTKFPPSSPKVQRYVQKGIPPAWRGEAWFFYAGGNGYLENEPQLYEQLVLRAVNGDMNIADKEAIERDLHRTFPDNIHFKPEGQDSDSETPLFSSLRRLLSAFAIHHPRIGYCQSLNFVGGLLLLFLPEEKAFWMLHIITTSYLPGTHELSLEGTNIDLWVLMLALRDNLPSVWSKIGTDFQPDSIKLPPISMCTTSWFMSLYIGILPIESVLRVWDVLFYEGSRTLFRVALAIFKAGETEIKNLADPMELFQVVQGLPRTMIAVGSLMDMICNQDNLKQRWVNKKRKERKLWFAATRMLERARKLSTDIPGKSIDLETPLTTPAESILEDDQYPPPQPILETARRKGNAWWGAKVSMQKSNSQ